MPTVAYATEEQLTEYLPTGITVQEPVRLLRRASELLDSKIRLPFTVDDETSLPVDTDLAALIAEACCAQVEHWIEVGEEHDVAGLHGRSVSIGHLSIDRLPDELAPRAFRLLHAHGLLSGIRVDASIAQAFFATESGT